MRVVNKCSFNHIEFLVVFDGETGEDAINVTLVQGRWRFRQSAMYFASEVDHTIEALQLARNIVLAIDATPERYETILAMAQTKEDSNVGNLNASS